MEKELFNENFWLSTSEPEETIEEGETKTIHKKKQFKIKFDKKKAHIVYIKKDFEHKLENKTELEEEVYMNLQRKFKDHFKMEFN